jgi:protein-S-isoprenylcysteine O-methyltransferase Ste14
VTAPTHASRPLGARLTRSISIGAFVAMLLGVIGLIAARHLFGRALPAILVQALAVLLFAWARVTLGLRSFHLPADPTPGALVTTGPYRFIRHPIYAAVCLFAWAGALDDASPSAVLLALVVSVGAIVRGGCEEHLMMERYPAYREYAASTGGMIPRLPAFLGFRRRPVQGSPTRKGRLD